MMNELLTLSYMFSLAAVMISSILYVNKRLPEYYIQVHINLLILPVLTSFLALLGIESKVELEIFTFDRLSWVLSFYISLLNWIIQRFSLRYMHGDYNYRPYFFLFTWTAAVASLIWSINDIRVLAIFWGFQFIGLVGLTWLKHDWAPSKAVARQMSIKFLFSWLSMMGAVLFIGNKTGLWNLYSIQMSSALNRMNNWDALVISILIIVAAIIPAGQWPFHRWLLNSAVTPTPVSAIMHAGLVNAGGILLTRFSPVLNSPHVPVLIFLVAFISIIIGTGISLVHADYKRQLVGSTMGQMGMMMVQCSLGAFSAAIAHLILHGFFKATLFLQSGSAVPHSKEHLDPSSRSKGWTMGIILGTVIGLQFWLFAPEEPNRLISSLMLMISVSVVWGRFLIFKEGRWTGILLVLLLAAISELFRHGLTEFVEKNVHAELPFTGFEWFVLGLFTVTAIIVHWALNHRSSNLSVRLYLWFVHIGEPGYKAVETHPYYISRSIRKGASHE